MLLIYVLDNIVEVYREEERWFKKKFTMPISGLQDTITKILSAVKQSEGFFPSIICVEYFFNESSHFFKDILAVFKFCCASIERELNNKNINRYIGFIY